MESRAKFAGHGIHPMLVVFPLGLFCTAIVFDVIGLASGSAHWFGMAFWMIAAGIVGALAAAVFGWVDWWAIPDGTRAKVVGLYHGIGNVLLVVLFLISWLIRAADPNAPPAAAFWFSFIGAGLALITGWLGGELVDRLGVGVDTGAHLDSPSSLSNRPASDRAEGYRPVRGMWSRRGKPVA